jgi:hypothetical protein
MNTKKFAVLFLGLVIVFVGTWTYTKAEGSTISVCANKSGVVYMVGKGFIFNKCGKNDQLITWNAAGPQGPKGDTGAVGPVGPQGPQGTPGSSSWNEQRIESLESRVSHLEDLLSVNPSVISYYFNGVAANAVLDFASSNPHVSISITASKPVYFYRVWICTKTATNCGNSLSDNGGTVQYFFRTVPPYITTYNSDDDKEWDGKDWQGIPVPNGEYMIKVDIADQTHNEFRYVLQPYTITVTNSPTI